MFKCEVIGCSICSTAFGDDHDIDARSVLPRFCVDLSLKLHAIDGHYQRSLSIFLLSQHQPCLMSRQKFSCSLSVKTDDRSAVFAIPTMRRLIIYVGMYLQWRFCILQRQNRNER